jgi:hypothetical protein
LKNPGSVENITHSIDIFTSQVADRLEHTRSNEPGIAIDMSPSCILTQRKRSLSNNGQAVTYGLEIPIANAKGRVSNRVVILSTKFNRDEQWKLCPIARPKTLMQSGVLTPGAQRRAKTSLRAHLCG